MPPKARAGSKTGREVYARDIDITKMYDKFYCCTPGCNTTMSVVNAGNPKEAFFRKLRSAPEHISYICVKNQLTFNPTEYDENKFDKNKAFKWLLKRNTIEKRGKTGTKTGSKGGGKPGMRALETIYSMCINKEKTDEYNGFVIDDLLADEENVHRYGSGMTGFLVVECSFYKKVYNKPALIMNYPTDFRSTHGNVKIIFEDENLCWKQWKKLKDCKHTEPIAIAGDWSPVEDNLDYQSECTIMSTRQIYYVKQKS